MSKFTRLFLCCAAFLLLTSPAFTASISVPVSASSATTTPDEKTVNSALDEFNSLSRREKKSRMRDVKKLLKEEKEAKAAGKKTDDNTILLAILAILLPPLAVYLKENAITTHFWISLILTLLFWLPGVIYAMLVVFDVI